MRGLRNAFIAGLILLAPLGVTIFVVNFLLENVGAPASKLFFGFLESDVLDDTAVKIVSTLVVIIFITIIGYFSNYFLGKITLKVAENVINRLPFINTIYSTVKQIVDTFSKQKQAVFQKTVIFEYPRKGTYAIGFLTGDSKGEIPVKTGVDVVNVFIPTTPNPTSGFLLMVPRDEVIPMEMAVADGIKLIISGGAVVPPYPLTNADGNPIDEVSINNPSDTEEPPNAS